MEESILQPEFLLDEILKEIVDPWAKCMCADGIYWYSKTDKIGYKNFQMPPIHNRYVTMWHQPETEINT